MSEEVITPNQNRYLILDETNTVTNIIVYDGVAEYNPGEGFTLEQHPINEDNTLPFVTIGSVKNSDGTFSYTEPETTP
jgi:hypothetical protein